MLAAHAWPVHLLAPPRQIRRIAPDLTFARDTTRVQRLDCAHTHAPRQPATPVWRLPPLEGSRISPAGRPEQPQLAAVALRAAVTLTPRYSAGCRALRRAPTMRRRCLIGRCARPCLTSSFREAPLLCNVGARETSDHTASHEHARRATRWDVLPKCGTNSSHSIAYIRSAAAATTGWVGPSSAPAPAFISAVRRPRLWMWSTCNELAVCHGGRNHQKASATEQPHMLR
eukprot:6059465-Prymnesium_polylepis.2